MNRKRSQLVSFLIFLIDPFPPINDFTMLSKEKQRRGVDFSCFDESRNDKVVIITKRNGHGGRYRHGKIVLVSLDSRNLERWNEKDRYFNWRG